MIVPLGMTIWFSFQRYNLLMPEMTGFNFRGGWTLTPEFAAMVIGLTLYTAAFNAEIIGRRDPGRRDVYGQALHQMSVMGAAAAQIHRL